MINYRIASLVDLENILEIKKEVKKKISSDKLLIWQNNYPSDDLLKEDIENGFGRILEVDDKIVSYASLYPCSYEYDSKTFYSDELMSFGRIMTKVSEVNKGYATSLIEHLIQEVKEKKYPGLGILVDNFNEKALNIYKKFGFKYCGTSNFPWAVLDKYCLKFNDEF